MKRVVLVVWGDSLEEDRLINKYKRYQRIEVSALRFKTSVLKYMLISL